MTGRDHFGIGPRLCIRRLTVPNLIPPRLGLFRHADNKTTTNSHLAPTPNGRSSCSPRVDAEQPPLGPGPRSDMNPERVPSSALRWPTRPFIAPRDGTPWGPLHGGDVYPKEAAVASTLGLHDGGPLDHDNNYPRFGHTYFIQPSSKMVHCATFSMA